jgi:hypothetical protein
MKQSRLLATILCLFLLLMQQAVALHDLHHGLGNLSNEQKTLAVSAIDELGNSSDEGALVCKTCLGLSHLTHLALEVPQIHVVEPITDSYDSPLIVSQEGRSSLQPSSRDPPQFS